MEHLESNILVFMDTQIYLIQLFTSNNNWKDISCKNVDAHSSNKKNTASLIIWSFIDCISMQFFAFCKVGKNCFYFTTGRNYPSCLKLHSKLIEFINTYLQQWLIDQPNDKFCCSGWPEFVANKQKKTKKKTRFKNFHNKKCGLCSNYDLNKTYRITVNN